MRRTEVRLPAADATRPTQRRDEAGHRRAQGTRHTFEAGLGDMMIVFTGQSLDVKSETPVHREGLKEFSHQLSIELANLRSMERSAKH